MENSIDNLLSHMEAKSYDAIKNMILKYKVPTLWGGVKAHLAIWGGVGIGKTSLAYDLADDLKTLYSDKEFLIHIWQPACSESNDFAGYMDIHPEYKDRVVFLKPELIMLDPEKLHIVVFDEFNRATVDVRNVLMGFFNNQPLIGTHHIEANVLSILCMNDVNDGDIIGVESLCDSNKTRMGHIKMLASRSRTTSWLADKYKDNHFVKYLQSNNCTISETLESDVFTENPDDKKIIPVPRTWEKACEQVKNLDISNDDDIDGTIMAITCDVGTVLAAQFLNYIADCKVLDWKEFIKEKPNKQFRDMAKSTEADSSLALRQAIGGAANNLKLISADEVKNLFYNLKAISKCHGDLTSYGLNSITDMVMTGGKAENHKGTVKALMKNPELTDFLVRFHLS